MSDKKPSHPSSNRSLGAAHAQPAAAETSHGFSSHTSSRESGATTNRPADQPSGPANSNPGPNQQRTHDTDAAAIPDCPYHGKILRLEHTPNNPDLGRHPTDLFKSDNPGSQSSLFIRPDNGQLSISKGCTCPQTKDSELII